MPGERNLFKEMWVQIRKSLKYKCILEPGIGAYQGVDRFGNRYYELAADPQVGRRNPSRWYESKNKDMLQELPPEWESWLRRRRTAPPTDEEIQRNMEISRMKKVNAAKMEEGRVYDEKDEFPKKRYWGTANSKFPRREEYERYPGEDH